MSEPLSAVEIEDVLSSIRRLVSEDLRPASRGMGPSAAVAVADVAKPALILTPALRVVPDAPGPHGGLGVEQVSPPPHGEPVLDQVAPPPICEVVASVGAAVPPQEWEPETGDAPVAAYPVWTEAAWDTVDEPAAVAAPGPVFADDMAFVTLSDTIVLESSAGDAMHAAPEESAGWAQVDEDEADPVLLQAPGVVAHGPDAEGPDAEGPDGDAPAGDAPGGDWADDAMAQRPAPTEVDAEWLSRAEAEVIAGLEQREAMARGATVEPLPDEPEMSFDEEALRDLVRDLIREELQGHLGERITRNIRKLVRAEIARALAAAELT